jgi:transposase
MDTSLMLDTTADRELGAGHAETVGGRSLVPRRQYAVELKRRIVEETFAPDASVAEVARRHGVNDNLVFEWRKQYRQGRLWHGKPEPAAKRVPAPACARVNSGGKAAMALPGPGLIRVGVIDHEGEVRPPPGLAELAAPPPPSREAVPLPPSRAATAGGIEIELPNGFRVRVDGEVDERALTRVLATIKQLA